MKVWQSYLENKTSGAMRMYWVYGIKEQKIQTLAAELDQLSYEIDTYEYRDSVSDRELQIQMIADDIRTGR